MEIIRLHNPARPVPTVAATAWQGHYSLGTCDKKICQIVPTKAENVHFPLGEDLVRMVACTHLRSMHIQEI